MSKDTAGQLGGNNKELQGLDPYDGEISRKDDLEKGENTSS